MSAPTPPLQTLPSFARFANHFRTELLGQRTLILASFSAMLAEVALRILEPWPLKFVIDDVLGLAPAGTGDFEFAQGAPPIVLLTLAAIGLVSLAGLRSLAGYSSTVGFALVGNRVLTEVRNALYRHLQMLSLRYHSRARKGDLLIRLMSDVGMLKEVAVTALLPLLGNLFVMGGMAVVMCWLNWRLSVILLLTVPFLFLVGRSKTRKIQEVARGQRKCEASMATTAAESLTGIEAVQALGLGPAFNDAFAQESRQSLKEGVKGKRLAAGLERSVDLVIAVAIGATVWFGARLVMARDLTPGELLVFLSYVKSAFKPVRNAAKYTARLAKASAATERVLEVMEEELEVRDLPGALPAPAFRANVEFVDVSFSYERDRPAVRDLSFAIEPGETVAIIGSSGSGKSTTAALLLRLYEPSTGTILIDGQDIRRWTVASLREQITIVLQDSLLFAVSIADNISFGSPGERHTEIVEAARTANAHHFIEALPDGYDTVLGERGVTLSVGQRQRLALARAAIRKTPILILDEPTTGLDSQNEREVMVALERLSVGRTTFLITHRLNQVATADRILYFNEGTIVEQGTPEQLRNTHTHSASLLCGGDAVQPHLPHKGANIAVE